MSTDIKILHSSCCGTNSPIREQIEKFAQKHSLEISLTELSDLEDTMIYGALSFPALVVNGKVYEYKKVNSDEHLLSIIKAS